MTFPILPSNSPATGYNIDKSLRFRASASAYLNRTPASAGNRQKFTQAYWVKRGQLGVFQRLATATNDALNVNWDQIYFDASDKLVIWGYSGTSQYQLTSNQVFRDPAAYFQLIVAYDTTQAVASDRIKVYVNGTQITFAAAYPTLNYNTYFNLNCPQTIGYSAGTFDGYLADVNFIDGQALTPASFGDTNAVTGVWQPIAYTGTYGTNGFYLDFEDTSSVAALGTDSSGNGNTWTVNNISLTAGVTYDSMTDVPTLTNATTANYAVLNPLDKYSTIAVSGGNLNAICADVAWRSGAMTFGNFTTGKWYYEITATNIGGSTLVSAGWELTSLNHTAQTGGVGAAAGNNFGIQIDINTRTTKVNGSTFSTAATSSVNGDVLMIAVDFDAGKGWVGKNGVWYDSGNPSAGASPCTTTVSGGMTPAYQMFNNGGFSANFGQRPFAYTPPTGFVALNTFNLPDSTIVKGNTVMDATLYTGNGSTQTITNAAGFQPDLVWVKGRSGATDHALYDSVRGTTKQLESNTTDAETTQATGLTAFGSAGFTVGALAQMNTNAATYVGWQWQAGQGSSSSNTNGSITSTVSVNPTAGFSVVTYTGTGSAATVGHGLGVAPKMIIVKGRTNVADWQMYHVSLGIGATINLNAISARFLSANYWGASAPTSSVFGIGTLSGNNNSGTTYVAYCFADIDGYSKFGSYAGNGSTDGAFIYTGFRPRFVMVKQTNDVGNWIIWDTARSTYNQMQLYLSPNSSSQELNNAVVSIDSVSNGFKCRTSDNDINGSGDSYIYMAFAENPFKNSLAR